MKRIFLVIASTLLSCTVHATPVKIGFVTTLTTNGALIGQDMKQAVDLAMQHLGGKAGNTPLEVIFADDAFSAETGQKVTEQLVKKDDVDFVAGYIWSNVLLASSKSVLDAGKFLITTNAGSSLKAGILCNPNFFSTGSQNDQTPMAMGEILNRKGVKSLFIMAPDYPGGQDMVAGVQRTFKGQVSGKALTPWGIDAQMDFSVELNLAQQSAADAIFAFYPGEAGVQFAKQYHQAGLSKKLPLYSVFTINALSLPIFEQDNIEGIIESRMTGIWDPTLDNEANRRFVSDYKERFGSYPSYYAAQSYDAIMLIASAVEATDGNLTDKEAVRSALKAANYASVRGKYTYGNNHFPIQNLYLREVIKDDQGKWTTKVVETVYTNHQDSYAPSCPMKN